MAIEESLNLDLGPALASIRGELRREIEQIPSTLRDSFGDALQGIASDVGAMAELAKDELDRVLGAPIEAPVEVDTSAVDEAAAAIDAAGQPIEAPVETDLAGLDEAEEAIEGLSGTAVEIPVEVDTGSIEAATADIETLAAAGDEAADAVASIGEAAGGGGGEGSFAAAGASASALKGAIEGLSGSQIAGIGAGTGLIATLGLFAREAIGAEAQTRSFEVRVGDLAETLNRVDVAGLNTSLSDLAIQLGADDDKLRLTLAKIVQLSDGSTRTREEVGELGQEFVALAAYLTAVNPSLGTVDDVLNSLPQALARGGRALVPFGISLSAAEVNARAFSETGKTVAEDLTIFDKAASGLGITMERLGPQIAGGIADASANAEVRMRSLKQEVLETIEAAGGPLIRPMIEALESVQPALLAVATSVGTFGEGIGAVLVPVLRAATPLIEALADGLNALPEPLVEGAAAALIAYKAYAPLAAGLSLVRGAAAALPALFSSSVGPLAALTIAQEAHAVAALADTAAQQALVVAEAELVVASTADTAAIVGLGVAQAGAVASAVALAAAEEAVAVAAAEATTALGPIALAAAAAAAAILIVTHRSDALKVSVTDLAKATNTQLVAAFQKLEDLGLGDEFFDETAAGSEEVASRLRDALQAAGIDVTKYTATLEAMAEQERQTAIDTAATGEAVKRTDAYVPPSVHNLQEYVSAQGAAADTTEGLAAEQERLQATLDANTAALEAEAAAAEATATGFRNSLTALNALIGVTFDATTQDLDFTIALDKMKAKQEDLIKTKGAAAGAYVLETAAGRANIASLVDQVKAQADLIGKNIEAGESIETATGRYAKQVEAIGKVAEQAGLTKEQYEGLLKQYGLTPAEIATKIALAGIPEAKTAADGLKTYIEALDPQVRARLTLDEVKFYEALQRVKDKINELGPNVDPGFAAEFGASQIPQAYGGIVYGAATGGLGGGIYSQAAGVMFNEPSARGEAYIPFAMDRRERATQVLGATAQEFGFSLVPQAREPLSLSSGSVAGGGGGTAVLERIASLLDGLPGRMPAPMNANIQLTAEEADVLGRLNDRLRGR